MGWDGMGWDEMSALSAGEPDECSVDVSLQTDKKRHCTTYMEKTEPPSISFVFTEFRDEGGVAPRLSSCPQKRITSAGSSVPGSNICRADVWRDSLLLMKHSLNAENINELKMFSACLYHYDACTVSHHTSLHSVAVHP